MRFRSEKGHRNVASFEIQNISGMARFVPVSDLGFLLLNQASKYIADVAKEKAKVSQA